MARKKLRLAVGRVPQLSDQEREHFSKIKPEFYELRNRMSRKSLAKATADGFIFGLRNNRGVLKEIVQRGEHEFIRIAKKKYEGLGFRQEDLKYIFARLHLAAEALDHPMLLNPHATRH